MVSVNVSDRQRRIFQLAQEWGVELPPAPSRLERPQHPPSFQTPADERAAEDLLQRRAAEAAQIRPRSGVSRVFSSSNLKSGKKPNPQDVMDALSSSIANQGSPGVAQALLGKLAASGVDLNGTSTKTKTGMLAKRRSLDNLVDRTTLLRLAVERDQTDTLQVLLPYADHLSLDSCLPIAIRRGNATSVELLLRYGAGVDKTADGQDAFRQACMVPGDATMIRLILQSDGRPSPDLASRSLCSAAAAGYQEAVLHLSRSTAADCNHNSAEALKSAISMGRKDVAMAITMGNKPPQRPGLDEAFTALLTNDSLSPNTKLELAELLLCAGATGESVDGGLQRACEAKFFDMVHLLTSYGASIEHNGAITLQHAIRRMDLDLVGSLLSDTSSLNPSLASRCAQSIPKQAEPDARHYLLTLLLKKGASGEALDQQLIYATQAGDTASVDLLLKPFFPDRLSAGSNELRKSPREQANRRHEVASVNFKSGEALKTVLLRADTVTARKMFEAQPSAETISAVFPLTKSLPAADRHHMIEVLLTGPLSGPSLHEVFQGEIAENINKRDDALIQLLLQHGADINFNHGPGLRDVILQQDLGLLSTLLHKASPQTAAAHISDVMEVADHRCRFEAMSLLLQSGATIASQSLAVALLQSLSEDLVDLSLLRLLLETGNADIDALEGGIIDAAVNNPDPDVLQMVFDLAKPSVESISRAMNSLAPLPSTDTKADKLGVILARSSRRPDLDWLLLKEVRSLSQKSANPLSYATVKLILDSGANPNTSKGSVLGEAVTATDAQLCDLLLSCRCQPTPESLGRYLPHALRISDPMDRLSFAKKLIDAGVYPTEVNRALIHSISAHADDISLLKVLAAAADTTDGEALSLAASKGSVEIMRLLLSKTFTSEPMRNSAFEKAMQLTDRGVRRPICEQLMKAGVTQEKTSAALLVAARDGDLELGDSLMIHGASMSTNGGQAIIEACRGGSPEVVSVLLRADPDPQRRTLERGFQAATEVGDLNKRAVIFEKLLQRGVSGEVVDAQLVAATRYGDHGHELLRVLLAAGADPNYHNGDAVYFATTSALFRNLGLLLGLWDETRKQTRVSPPTLVRAFKASWNLSRDSRFKVIDDLMKAGLPVTDDLHVALNDAVNEDEPEPRLVKLLLDHGASPAGNSCKTLIDAAQKFSPESLSLLLHRDIAPEDLNRAFIQSFTSATLPTWFSEGGYETAKLLLNKGTYGDAVSSTLVLVMSNYTEDTASLANRFFDLLVSHNPNVDYSDGAVLQLAASKANISWTQSLLKCRPSTDTLSYAFNNIFDTEIGQDDAIELFKIFTDYQDGETRVDVMAVQPGAQPVLVRAMSQYPRSTRILEMLLNAGYYHGQMTTMRLHEEIEEEEEMTILTWAVAQPQKRISTALIELLLENGANPKFETRLSKTTPLMLAIQNRRPDVVKALILSGAEVDVGDFLDRSPLSMATEIGGNLAIEMMSSLLAAEPSTDDGSLHNAARALTLPVVQVLVQAGHDPDFPSPRHNGRSALAEVCLHGSDGRELTVEQEKTMQKVMAFLIESKSDLTIKSDNKSLLHLCFDAADPLTTTRCFLKVGMWKHLNSSSNLYTDGEYTYSPTMYISKLLPASDMRDRLLSLIRDNRGRDVYYANSGPQPDNAVGLPEDMEVNERMRRSRLERLAEESQDYNLALARKRELANVEQQIWSQKAQMEDARRRKLHDEDLAALRSRAQVEESLAASSFQRRLSEQRGLTDAAASRTRGELEAEELRQRKMLEWEGRLNTERVGNARALSALRVSEREEVDRFEREADKRLGKRIEMQRKLVDSQERLARSLAAGPGGNQRQIGYVTGELN